MSLLHKADTCLNHAMSVNVGHCIPDAEGYSVSTREPSTVWPKLLAFIERPHREERSVQSFYSHTIDGHSTTLSSVVRDGKRYVWYHNPWGLDGDLRDGKYEIVFAPDQQTFDNVDAAQIEDIRKVLHFSDQLIPESDKIKLHGLSVMNMVNNLLKRPDKKKRDEQICAKWNLWRSQGHMKNEKLPQYHVMSIVALLKFATDSDHLIPIHPFDSMKAFGPQQDDGLDIYLQKVTRIGGACVLWSKVYMQKVKKVMNDLLKHRVAVVSEADLLDTIKNTLTRSPIGEEDDQEHTPQLALARLMDSHGGQIHWKTILSLVYDMLPEFGERPPIRTTRIVAGENPYFHAAWHVEALWKLDLVARYVEESLVQNYGSIGSGDFKPECVAGFIEVMFIVSSAETRESPGYTELVGSIATYIVKRRLHKLPEVEVFTRMVKMLIKCKQESPGDEVGTRVRQSYPLPTSTRGDQENAQFFLQKHADTYGYGVSSTSEFREDPRKKRRTNS